MIVCVCNNVSDRKIRQAVDEGMSTMTELRDNLDVATCCGKCHACAKHVLRECLEDVVVRSDPHPVQPMMFKRVALAA
jgi:bacterioferritin-associated ferredoxin